MIRVVDTIRTIVPASATAVNGPPVRQGRVGFSVHNDSTSALKITYVVSATATIYDEFIDAGGIYETPPDQCVIGAISCIWMNAAPSGSAYFSERVVSY